MKQCAVGACIGLTGTVGVVMLRVALKSGLYQTLYMTEVTVRDLSSLVGEVLLLPVLG